MNNPYSLDRTWIRRCVKKRAPRDITLVFDFSFADAWTQEMVDFALLVTKANEPKAGTCIWVKHDENEALRDEPLEEEQPKAESQEDEFLEEESPGKETLEDELFEDEPLKNEPLKTSLEECDIPPIGQVVKAYSKQHLDALTRATVIVTNIAQPYSWVKREDQILLHFWSSPDNESIGWRNPEIGPGSLAIMQRELLIADALIATSGETGARILEGYDILDEWAPEVVAIGDIPTDSTSDAIVHLAALGANRERVSLKASVIAADQTNNEALNMLLYRMLSMEDQQTPIVVITRDVRQIRTGCLASNSRVIFRYTKRAINSGFLNAKSSQETLHIAADLLFPWIAPCRYTNLKPSETFTDRIIRSRVSRDNTRWMFTWNRTMDSAKLLENADGYSKTTLYCFNKDELPEELLESQMQICDVHDIRNIWHDKMSVLIIASYDSTNNAVYALAHELMERGHLVTVIASREYGASNMRVFEENGIMVKSLERFVITALNYVDCAIIPPFRNKKLNRVLKGIHYRRIMTFAFSGLFSSVAMRTYPDYLFVLGKNKLAEFEKYHLRYSTIIAGNPQYDKIAGIHRDTKPESVRKAIFIDQGAYPYGSKGKRQLADFLVKIANENPTMEIHVKPRYLPDDTEGAIHQLSEHIYDYIPNPPDNLVLMKEYANLEDIIGDYDGMIVMWSTCYLDALVAEMPVLIVKGFDSVDVFDVRTQRIDEAYEWLEGTGCVHDFREVKRLDGLFKKIDSRYADNEVYRHDTGRAGDIIDFMEFCHGNLILKDVRLRNPISCSIDEFYQLLPALETRDAQSSTHYATMKYLDGINASMQSLAYQDRCMGHVLDLSQFERYYDFDFKDAEIRPVNIASDIRSVRGVINQEFEDVKTQYFEDPETLSALENNPVLQDYYFDWAMRHDREDILMEPPFESQAESSRLYNLGRWHLKQGNRKKAYSYMMRFLAQASCEEVVQFRKVRLASNSLIPFRRQLHRKLTYINYLYSKASPSEVDIAYDGMPESAVIGTFCMVHALNREKDYVASVQCYENHREIVEMKRQSKRRTRRSKQWKRIARSAAEVPIYLAIRNAKKELPNMRESSDTKEAPEMNEAFRSEVR